MGYLQRRLKKSQNNKSVFDSIKEKNTNPTEESILSFTEREFIRCFTDIKEKVEHVRLENGKFPFCGEQFLEPDYVELLKRKQEVSASNVQSLDRSDFIHLKGIPVPDMDGDALDVKNNKAVQNRFNLLADKWYPEIRDYEEGKCDIETCKRCRGEML